MAAELVTPTDERTGLPYLIAPEEYWLPTDNGVVANKHHLWHPSNAEVFETLEGAALRASMLQAVEADLHNYGARSYHRFYTGPELPRTKDEIFGRCILACAGVLPGGVIDLRSGEPVERTMTRRERNYFRTASSEDEFGYRYIRYGYEQIKNFLTDYVLDQQLNHIKPIRIEEFLFTKDLERKNKIGMLLLSSAIAVASEGVRDSYIVLRRENELHPRMPKEPQTLIRYKLGHTKRRLKKVIRKLETRLEEQVFQGA